MQQYGFTYYYTLLNHDYFTHARCGQDQAAKIESESTASKKC